MYNAHREGERRTDREAVMEAESEREKKEKQINVCLTVNIPSTSRGHAADCNTLT